LVVWKLLWIAVAIGLICLSTRLVLFLRCDAILHVVLGNSCQCNLN
jgi:hypothetical protein